MALPDETSVEKDTAPQWSAADRLAIARAVLTNCLFHVAPRLFETVPLNSTTRGAHSEKVLALYVRRADQHKRVVLSRGLRGLFGEEEAVPLPLDFVDDLALRRMRDEVRKLREQSTEQPVAAE